MRILLVEDDRNIAQNIREFLTENTFSVDVSNDGDEGLQMALWSAPYDCIILDRMLPGKEGAEICREVREAKIKTPIIMLTAKDGIDARIEGLNAGADDYVTKPFSLRELLARINAQLRRSYDTLENGTEIIVDTLRLNTVTKKVYRDDVEITLSKKHFQILEFLMRNKWRVVSKTEIEEHIWDMNATLWSDVVRSHIQIIRAKVDKDYGKKLIHTVHGMGYILTDEETWDS